MRDYWLTKDLLQAAGIVFMVLSLAGMGLAHLNQVAADSAKNLCRDGLTATKSS